MSGEKKQEMVSNPFSTGGGGTVFEHKVQASLLASLLVRSHVPGFDTATIQELHFQAEYLGYETDDAVLIATDSTGQLRKQLWSVKHDVRFTQKDAVFQDVLRDAWADFLNPDSFDQSRDAIVLATGPLPVTYKHLLTLLEIIRATSSFSDFEKKARHQGFISQEAHGYFSLVCGLIEGITGTKPQSPEVWKFLRIFHILGFDFDQAASKDEARFKSLLALATRAGTGRSGENLWNQVFKWVAEGNPRAGSFTHDNLPEDWPRDANAISVHFESGVIERLSEHSKLALRRVRSKIGSDHQLPRTEVIGGLAASFIEQPMTLVSGEAGVGKSAAAWMALKQVAHGAPVFVFQAKEFAYDHLDHALADMRIHESLSRISSLFGLQRRKFILLESVERLLEASERDAFADLLTILTEDSTWRIVLTCRHHAVNLVKDSFLSPSGIHSNHISVPRLGVDELDLVLSKKHDLRDIVKDDRTRYFLRNPWFLDKACSINWSGEAPKRPLDQTQLREALWRQIVTREDAKHGGIHRKRDRVFREIALGRARSMRSFVEAPEGEEAAVQALLADELLVEDTATGFVAPAHDVLEDWALVRWVAQVFDSTGHDPLRFFDELGRQLQIRRAYRQWLHESLDGPNHLPIRKFTDAVLSLANVPNYWRDETVISLLLSDNAPAFIQNYEVRLLANGKAQLQVVIHLLRLACKRLNPFWDLPERIMAEQFGDTHLTPNGAAWPAILQLIHRNLPQFDSYDLPYLLTLLEDWKSGINWQTLQPEGTREVGLVALHFWKLLDDDYKRKDDLRRLLDVMLTMPQAFPAEFEAMIREEITDAKEDRRRSYRKKCLDEKLLSFGGCAMTCRSHPTLVAEIARKKWHLDRPQPSQSRYGWSGDMESHFGLPTSSFEYLPPSALQGPFRMLLSNHQEIGITLILDLVNTTTQRFVEGGLDSEFGDPPVEFEFPLDDQTNCTQWVNERLWLIHRGTKPAPHVVESALMALEKHLLELAKANCDLSAISKDLIARSNSIAVTAVIASVAMAYPEAVGDVALIFLNHNLFFDLDRSRYVHDQSFFDIGEVMYDHIQRLHHRERIESSKLPHRNEHLESLTLKLQTGPLRDRVWEIIDEWNEELQEIEDQTEEIKLLRFRFHRIDLRNFTVKRTLDDGRVMFTATEPAADIVQVISESAPSMVAKNEAAELVVWGTRVFEGRELDRADPSLWRRMLERAQHAVEEREQGEEVEISAYEGGPGYVAAVCVRDHWKELDATEREWCRDFLLTELLRGKEARNPLLRVHSTVLTSQIPAARVLPILLDDADEPTALLVREAIAVGLTHAIVELREHTALGIGAYLWDRDPDWVDCCIGALLDFAGNEADLHERWLIQGPQTLRSWDDVIDDERFRIRKSIAERTFGTLLTTLFDPAKRINLRSLIAISHIISDRHHLPIAHAFYLHVAEYFVTKWNNGQDSDDDYGNTRDYHGEAALKRQLEHFIVRCDAAGATKLWTPFKEAIGNHAKEVADMFEGLVSAEDLAGRSEGFWQIWKETGQAILAVPQWNDRLGNEDGGLSKLTSALLFDGVPWKEEAREWAPLRGHEVDVREFAMQVATTPPACKALIRLLAGIGAFLLPQALSWVDEILKKSDIRLLIGSRNELFNLSRILSPFVFGRTSLIRSDQALRDAALRILDAMVDQGSSAAYRMRDVLISPISVATSMH